MNRSSQSELLDLLRPAADCDFRRPRAGGGTLRAIPLFFTGCQSGSHALRASNPESVGAPRRAARFDLPLGSGAAGLSENLHPFHGEAAGPGLRSDRTTA